MQDHLNHGRLRTHPHVTDKKTGQGVGSSWIKGGDVVVVACLGVGGLGLLSENFLNPATLKWLLRPFLGANFGV